MRAHFSKSIVLLTTLLLLAAIHTAALADASSRLFAPVAMQTEGCTTVVNPGQSIQAAVEAAKSGDVICVRAGIYQERIQIKTDGLTLMAYPGDARPVIDGANVLPVKTAKNRFGGLVQIGADNVTIDGFEVKRSAIRGLTIGKANVIVRNMIISDSYDVGLIVTGSTENPARNVLIENNVVYNNILKNAGGATGGSALTFVQAADSIARGNRVYHNYGEGLVAGRWTSGLLFEDNTVYDNRGANLYMVNTQNPVVQRNFIFCTNDPISWRGKGNMYRPGPGLQVRDETFKKEQPPASSGQIIVNNIVVGCGQNFGVSSQLAGGGLNNAVVANNSFINARGSATGAGANNLEFDGRASLRNTRFVNNIIVQTVPGTITRIQYATGTPNLSSFTVSNNLYSRTPTNGWPMNEAGRVIADPLLVSLATPLLSAIPVPGSYALTAGSPAIDRGTNVSQVTHDIFQDPRVGALDIGADELGGSSDFPSLNDVSASAEHPATESNPVEAAPSSSD